MLLNNVAVMSCRGNYKYCEIHLGISGLQKKSRKHVVAHWRVLQIKMKAMNTYLETQLAGIQLLASEGNVCSGERSAKALRDKMAEDFEVLTDKIDEMGDDIKRAQQNLSIIKCTTLSALQISWSSRGQLALCNPRGRYAEWVLSSTDRVKISVKEAIQSGFLFLSHI